MLPPIFQVCAADPGVTALLGNSPVRIFPFGRAPQGVELPYAVWQVIGGSPENYLAGRPDIDGTTIQINVYGSTGAQAHNAAEAIRYAIELTAHVVRWGGDDTDPETDRPFTSFDVDWWVNR